jgi:hypothetical protein
MPNFEMFFSYSGKFQSMIPSTGPNLNLEKFFGFLKIFICGQETK